MKSDEPKKDAPTAESAEPTPALPEQAFQIGDAVKVDGKPCVVNAVGLQRRSRDYVWRYMVRRAINPHEALADGAWLPGERLSK